MASLTLMIQTLLLAVIAFAAGRTFADTVSSHQRNGDNQSVTISSHDHGAPPKVVPQQSNQQVNPVVIVSPQGVGQSSTTPTIATTRKKQ